MRPRRPWALWLMILDLVRKVQKRVQKSVFRLSILDINIDNIVHAVVISTIMVCSVLVCIAMDETGSITWVHLEHHSEVMLSVVL